jgi:hypothetical protein
VIRQSPTKPGQQRSPEFVNLVMETVASLFWEKRRLNSKRFFFKICIIFKLFNLGTD